MPSLAHLLKDPPPAYAFELSEEGIAFARVDEPAAGQFLPLSAGVLVVSPVQDNLQQPHVVLDHIHSLVPANGRRRRRAALILPDYCARVSVLDFDAFPGDPAQQLALLRFRMKKTVPFDVDSAILSYSVESRLREASVEVLVAVIAADIVGQYEAPFRAAGFHPGMVTTSSLAALNLIDPRGVTMLVKRSGRVLSLLVLDDRAVKLARCVEMDEGSTVEMESVLHPTAAYIEDQLKARLERVWLGGFGPEAEELARRWQTEWRAPVEPLRSRFGGPAQNNTGLLGYLESVA